MAGMFPDCDWDDEPAFWALPPPVPKMLLAVEPPPYPEFAAPPALYPVWGLDMV